MESKWYYELAEKDVWEKEILTNAPSVIAYEYKSLYDLLSEGAIYGVFFKVKDIFETILKFPVLFALSEIVENENFKTTVGFQDEVFPLLMGKLPALGDWERIGQAVYKHNCKSSPIYEVLKDVLSIYEKNRVTNWRNVYLGHGALPDLEKLELQKDLIKRIEIIHNHFSNHCMNYKAIFLEINTGEEYVTLKGFTNARQLPYDSGNLFGNVGNKRVPLIPFIQYIDHGIYFYDSYENKLLQGHFLNYNNGYKRTLKDNLLDELYNKISIILNHSRISSASIEDPLFRKSFVESLEIIKKPFYRYSMNFIKDRLLNYVNEESNGMYLLQMEDGMGKTTFVKMMDQLQPKKQKLEANIICRAVYINSFYANSVKTIIRNIQKAMQTLPDGDSIEGDLPDISENPKTMCSELYAFIQEIMDYYKQNYYYEKLILFIDGVDELPISRKNFVHLFAHSGNLPKGIYIVFTSRLDGQLSSFTKRMLAKINFKHKIQYTSESDNYKNIICDILSNRLNIDARTANLVRKNFQGKIINLELAINAYKQYGEELLVTRPASMINWFFDNVKRLYGDYHNELLKLCLVLTLVSTPISLKMISELMGERKMSFELLFNIYIINPILQIDHTDDDTLIGIIRPEVRAYILKFEVLKEEIVDEWINYINYIITEDHFLDEEFHVWLIKLSSIDIIKWNRIIQIEKFIDYLSDMAHIQKLSSIEYEMVKRINDRLAAYIQENKANSRKRHYRYMSLLYMEKLSCVFTLFDDYRYALEKFNNSIDIIEKDRNRTQSEKYILSSAYLSAANICSSLGDSEGSNNYLKRKDNLTRKEQSVQNRTVSRIKRYNNDSFLDDAKMMIQRGKYQKAITILQSAIKEIPCMNIDKNQKKHIETISYDYLAQIFGHLGSEEFIFYFSLAEKGFNELSKCSVEKYVNLANAHLNSYRRYGAYCRAFHRLGKFEEALQYYKKVDLLLANTLAKSEMPYLNDVSYIYLCRGDLAFDLENYNEAVQYYTKVIEIYDEFHKDFKGLENYACRMAYECRSLAFSKLGEDDKAKEDINQRKSRFSEPLDLNNMGGWKYEICIEGNGPNDVIDDKLGTYKYIIEAKGKARQGKYKEAVEILIQGKEKLQKLDIDNVQKDHSEVVYNGLLAQYLVDIDPNKSVNYYLMEEEGYKKLLNSNISTFKKFAELQLKSYRRYFVYASALFNVGKFKEAKQCYDKIEMLINEAQERNEMLNPHDTCQIYLGMGDFAYNMGNYIEAVHYYSNVIETYDKYQKKIQGLDEYACRVALECRSLAYSKLGEKEKAQEDITQRTTRFSEPIDLNDIGNWKYRKITIS